MTTQTIVSYVTIDGRPFKLTTVLEEVITDFETETHQGLDLEDSDFEELEEAKFDSEDENSSEEEEEVLFIPKKPLPKSRLVVEETQRPVVLTPKRTTQKLAVEQPQSSVRLTPKTVLQPRVTLHPPKRTLRV